MRVFELRRKSPRLVREERGITDLFAMLYCLLVTVFVVYTICLGYQMFLTQQVLSEVARRGILMMEMAGGMTPEIQNALADELARRGLQETQISGTKAPVPYREEIQLRLNYPYQFFNTRIFPSSLEVALGGVRSSISLRNPR